MARVTILLVAGILTAIHSSVDKVPSVTLTLFLFAFAIAVIGKQKILAGFSGLALVFISGFMLVQERSQIKCELPDSDGAKAYKVVVTRFAEERARSYRTQGEIMAIEYDSGWRCSCGSILIYFPKGDSVVYEYGDMLLVRGTPMRIPGPANPGEFDFRRFMEFKGVFVQDFLRRDKVILLGHEPPNHFLDRAIRVRGWADATLKSFVKGEREQATATALVLGVTDGLDNELLQAYASTGALHVLAVSGLHVSIIYWIILLLLKPLDRTRPLKWLLAFISVFVLWSYAFVTGWSPSVLRAVTMFSFIAFSRPWRQSTNIYNTLASSMFCLLLYDPFFIMSVGFQLSYLAVFGIVFLQPRLYGLWTARHRITDEVWKLSSVSIAAQIATLPISLYYFHQFPNYFLPANLVVIPVSFVVLVTGLSVAAFAFIEPVASVLGWLLTWSVKLMNYLVITFGQLPYSVIDGIYIDQWQAIALAGLILATVLLFILKSFRCLIIALFMAIGFSVLQWHHFYSDVEGSVTRVYSASGHTMINLIENGRSSVVADVLAPTDWATVWRYVQPSWIRAGVRADSGTLYLGVVRGSGFNAWIWRDKSFLQLHDRLHDPPVATVDFLIISNSSVATMSELAGVKCEKIIVDSSNSFYFAERLRKEAAGLGVPLWSVPHDGAFEYRHAIR